MSTLIAAERGYTYATTADIEILDCPECGIHYGIMADFKARRLRDHRTWYCPNGHPIHFPQDNEEEKLRKQLAQQRESTQWYEDQYTAARRDAEHQRRSAIASRGHLTRIKNRIANGVCPVPGCRRSGLGADVIAHIATCHPDFHGHEATP